MRSLLAVTLLLSAVGLLVTPAAGPALAAEREATTYVCPMSEHPQVFDKPGTCPQCGMRLVARSELKKLRHTVAILVFEGVQIIDYAAPYEVFGQAHFEVFTVGPTKAAITTAMGSSLNPSYGFADAPPADILVLPGGEVNTDDARIVDWVRNRSASAEVVLSVCNGAFWLAKAGLLDGLTATTFHRVIDELQAAAPKAHVVRDRRFVDNGKIVTSAGLTSGMDGSLHVVEKLLGRDRARGVALHLEYDWHPDSQYARANLADRYLPNLELNDADSFEVTSSLGDLDHWTLQGRLTTRDKAPAVFARIAEQLTTRAHWRPAAGTRDLTQRWSFADDRGRPWEATLALVPDVGPGSFQATLTLDRSQPTAHN